MASLTPKLAWQLAAPHTWPAAIMPAFIAYAAAAVHTRTVSWIMALVLLAICVLMQSSVNTFNDYFDFVKGTDTADDNVEESDSVLVYNDINPKSALALAIGFLAAAFILGIYVVAHAGLIPLIIALIAAVFVFLYSGGKTPLSYLPVGEAVSGIVMGGLIPLACYQALTGVLDFRVLLWAVPTIIGVSLIMMTNNTCDIEKDVAAKRRTLPCLLGRPRSRSLYSFLMALWVAAIAVLVAVFFIDGVPVLIFMIAASYPFLKNLFCNPLVPLSRIAAMGQICTLNVVLGAFYGAAIFASAVLPPLWLF